MTIDASQSAASRSAAPISLMGVPGSPYTRKMLAVLRYRRIPYQLILGSHTQTAPTGRPEPRVRMLPTFYLPDADGVMQAVTDSTPLIRRFEAEYDGRRAVPGDPVLALIDALIEDYADEWLTKAMFHYRWAYEADISKAGSVLPVWARAPQDDATLAINNRMISDRQIARLRYVGSNPTTARVIESSYERFLDAFEDHLRSHRYLLGKRPGTGDFGIYGQLTQLAHFDPTPMAVTVARAPRVYGWSGLVDDLSGVEPAESDWFDTGALPDTLMRILGEIGRVYPPLLLANAAALKAGDKQVQTIIDGSQWVQDPFVYQGKCLAWLRRDHAALSPADREHFDRIIAGSGCEPIFA